MLDGRLFGAGASDAGNLWWRSLGSNIERLKGRLGNTIWLRRHWTERFTNLNRKVLKCLNQPLDQIDIANKCTFKKVPLLPRACIGSGTRLHGLSCAHWMNNNKYRILFRVVDQIWRISSEPIGPWS